MMTSVVVVDDVEISIMDIHRVRGVTQLLRGAGKGSGGSTVVALPRPRIRGTWTGARIACCARRCPPDGPRGRPVGERLGP
ncbi:hypothetical protein CTKZ_30680 [Cellulomonas algicola]|uniref:Uncharacterized protein n=1 Tax=Cellulomonas algicola TaxID=2071633 RepID=A0A401V3P4_9CELL|nr:hypothetical protein CTKZ_30680 [Cellulomonas algicola]